MVSWLDRLCYSSGFCHSDCTGVVFATQIVQVFRQPDARIPVVIWISTIIFLALFSGTFQLTLSDPTSLLLAQTGNGGGTIGWAVADAALGFVNVPIAALIFAGSADVYLFGITRRCCSGYS